MGRGASARLQREDFHTSRLLEYFSEKELSLQTGHEPDRWPEVVLKELLDNALDACESHDILPAIDITITDDAIRVQDNGPGLSAEVVRGILDFSVRVSSKDAYISPTRGAQGNALKTLLAIPFVLSEDGGPEPVLIISQGQRHRIRVSLDRIAQAPKIQASTEAAAVKNGTCIEVDRFLPLVQAFSLINPHATITLTQGTDVQTFTRTTPDWTKWRPIDPTSPHWYDLEQFRNLIAAYVHAEQQDRPARSVRDFLAEFKGLTSTVKRSAVLDGLPFNGKHLHDLVANGDLDDRIIGELLMRMQQASSPVKPQALGVLGEAHLRTWLEAHGGAVHTVKYKRDAVIDATTGLPFVLEVAFAAREDDGPRRLVTGLNFSPTLVNPFRSLTPWVTSLDALLADLYVSADDPVTVVVHLVAPGLRFTDRGKSTLETQATVGATIAEAVRAVTKSWTALKKQEQRDQSRRLRKREKYYRALAAQEWSVKDAAYEVMSRAYTKAAGQIGLALARMIFYAARPLMQELTEKSLDSRYFTQTLLPAYQADHPQETAGWDVVYDARGHLQEPHTGRQLDLGTLDVRRYLTDARQPLDTTIEQAALLSAMIRTAGPRHRYANVLFIEKEGFLPLLERARLAERYDLAIMSTKGMSSTAARSLLEGLGAVRFLCLRDFDKAGFSIVATLTRDTARYQFRVRPEVVDLGLRLADVQAEGLAAERCSYGDDRNPAKNLQLNGATKAEIKFLLADGGQRVELNAFTSDQFIRWLEAKLDAAGVVKLIPDEATLTAAYQRAVYIETINAAMEKAHEAAQALASTVVPPADLHQAVARHLDAHKTEPWDAAVATIAANREDEVN